jgi:polyisoprenoid-binding protein YceI
MIRRACAILGVIAWAFAAPVWADGAPWVVDQSASRLEFHAEIGSIAAKGGFADWSATIQFAPHAPEAGSVTVAVNMASVFIDAPPAQAAIAGPAWLNVASHPRATFVGSGFQMGDDGRFVLTGALTLLGRSRPVSLTGKLIIAGDVAHATASAQLARGDFAVGEAGPPVAPYVTVTATLTARRGQ